MCSSHLSFFFFQHLYFYFVVNIKTGVSVFSTSLDYVYIHTPKANSYVKLCISLGPMHLWSIFRVIYFPFDSSKTRMDHSIFLFHMYKHVRDLTPALYIIICALTILSSFYFFSSLFLLQNVFTHIKFGYNIIFQSFLFDLRFEALFIITIK